MKLLILSQANNTGAGSVKELVPVVLRAAVEQAITHGIEVQVVSAKYGLVGLTHPVEPYEQAWTRTQAARWSLAISARLDVLLVMPYTQVGIAVPPHVHEVFQFSKQIWRAYASKHAIWLHTNRMIRDFVTSP